MDVVDRASSAAAAARLTSEQEVDVMTALLETKQKAEAAQRHGRWSAIGVAAAAVAVVGAGVLLALNAADGTSQQQPTAPSPSAPPAVPSMYGAAMSTPVAAPLPPGWIMADDDQSVCFWSPTLMQPDTPPASIFIVQPSKVFDPVTHSAITTPTDYLGWVRSHPWLNVEHESDVTVDGRPAIQLELSASGGPSDLDPADGFSLHYAGMTSGHTGFYLPGERMTLTVMDLDGRPLVIEGFRISPDSEFAPAYDQIIEGIRVLG